MAILIFPAGLPWPLPKGVVFEYQPALTSLMAHPECLFAANVQKDPEKQAAQASRWSNEAEDRECEIGDAAVEVRMGLSRLGRALLVCGAGKLVSGDVKRQVRRSVFTADFRVDE